MCNLWSPWLCTINYVGEINRNKFCRFTSEKWYYYMYICIYMYTYSSTIFTVIYTYIYYMCMSLCVLYIHIYIHSYILVPFRNERLKWLSKYEYIQIYIFMHILPYIHTYIILYNFQNTTQVRWYLLCKPWLSSTVLQKF